MKAHWQLIEEKILGGKHLYGNVFDDMIEASLAKIPRLSEKMIDLERIIEADKHFPCQKFMRTANSLVGNLIKSELLAMRLKNKGDKYFLKSEFGSALLCYNLALSFARNKSNESGQIYAQRGALFLQTLDIDKALRDTLDGLQCPCTTKQIAGLKEQRLTCLGYIYRANTAQFPDKQKNPEFQAYSENTLFKIKGEKHPIMPSASTDVKMKYSSEKGRHLVATKDIEPGITLIVESPYVSVLDNALQWEMKHCCWCYKQIWRTVPCEGCVFAVYCDEKCRLEDFNHGHMYTCGCLPYFHAAELDDYDLLALMAICRAGPKYIYELFLDSRKEKPGAEPIEKNAIEGFNPQTGLYDSDSYYQILHLMTHTDNHKFVKSCSWTALSIVKILRVKSDFFFDIPDSDKGPFEYFVGSLVLRNMVSFTFNGVAMVKSETTMNHPYSMIRSQKEDKEGITGIFSLVSTMNHSCEPNITWHQSRDGRLAIITKQSIKTGEQIYFSYGFSYTYYELSERKMTIFRGYRFYCTCVACTLKWPLKSKFKIGSRQKFMCPSCMWAYSRVFFINNCSLKESGKNGVCELCKKKFPLSVLKRECKKYETLLKKVDELIATKMYVQAIPDIFKCISYFQMHVKQPSPKLIQAQEMLWLVYCRIIDI